MPKAEYHYILCKNGEGADAGRKFTTTINLDSYKDFETFIKMLLKRKEITAEEAEAYTAIYYA